MSDEIEEFDEAFPDWDLKEWEQALTIKVGTASVCRKCGNVVMVTRGGVGVMELTCCGARMETPSRPPGAGESAVS